MLLAVKHCCKLRSSRAYREESASVLVVGSTPIQEIAGLTTIKTLFLAPEVEQLPGEAEAFALKFPFPTAILFRKQQLRYPCWLPSMQASRRHALSESANPS